jgi:ribosome-associated heat shock protein Hsp15
VRSPERVRLDKWLWAVRLYKSRSLAAAACDAGHVKVNGDRVKPAREIHVDETITARAGHLQRTVRVRGLLDQRVGARLVPAYLEDLTPSEEYQRAREEAAQSRALFPQGFRRATRKQRRQRAQLF